MARRRSLDIRRGRLTFVHESESEDLPGYALQEFLGDWGWGQGTRKFPRQSTRVVVAGITEIVPLTSSFVPRDLALYTPSLREMGCFCI